MSHVPKYANVANPVSKHPYITGIVVALTVMFMLYLPVYQFMVYYCITRSCASFIVGIIVGSVAFIMCSVQVYSVRRRVVSIP